MTRALSPSMPRRLGPSKEELTDSVDVQVGDATALEFPDEIFDFVVAVQVYSFVPNVARAIEEGSAWVLRKGRLAVLVTSNL